MNEDESEQIKQQRLQQLQQKREQEGQIKVALMKVLEPKAYERMMNVRIANEDLYMRVSSALLQYSSQAQKKISDGELKELLIKLTRKKEGSIEIKRK